LPTRNPAGGTRADVELAAVPGAARPSKKQSQEKVIVARGARAGTDFGPGIGIHGGAGFGWRLWLKALPRAGPDQIESALLALGWMGR
jgi:hypothetical protein